MINLILTGVTDDTVCRLLSLLGVLEFRRIEFERLFLPFMQGKIWYNLGYLRKQETPKATAIKAIPTLKR